MPVLPALSRRPEDARPNADSTPCIPQRKSATRCAPIRFGGHTTWRKTLNLKEALLPTPRRKPKRAAITINDVAEAIGKLAEPALVIELNPFFDTPRDELEFVQTSAGLTKNKTPYVIRTARPKDPKAR